ncbi:MAG TPA: ACP S-malonyltransferase [Aggregatilineales bacterium]|nr:ACP S-malonyltransferase [Anaerolineales bacterium]HRE48139.1 ACP S-malonyltransferase [Aggregatilineales bacterium]
MTIQWEKTVLLFPGQGSQAVGMGAEIAAEITAAREVYALADSILGYSLSRLCFEGPAEQLDLTQYTQPALYVTGIAVLHALEAVLGEEITPLAAAGHSLGEFTALTTAGALPFDAGLRLVAERGRLMAEAGEKHPGGMAALLGGDLATAHTICDQASRETGNPVVIANDNCPGQVVISGDNLAITCALELAKAHGIRRAVRLHVSVATHSPLMEPASASFRTAIQTVRLRKPFIPVIGNVSAALLPDAEAIQAELNAQLTSTVRWSESIMALRRMGGETFLELGSKDVLSGLLKRIDSEATAIPVNTLESLQGLAAS